MGVPSGRTCWDEGLGVVSEQERVTSQEAEGANGHCECAGKWGDDVCEHWVLKAQLAVP